MRHHLLPTAVLTVTAALAPNVAAAQALAFVSASPVRGAPSEAALLTAQHVACRAPLGPDSTFAVEHRTGDLWMFDNSTKSSANLTEWASSEGDRDALRKSTREQLQASSFTSDRFKAELGKRSYEPPASRLKLPPPRLPSHAMERDTQAGAQFDALRATLAAFRASLGLTVSKGGRSLFDCAFDVTTANYKAGAIQTRKLTFTVVRPRSVPNWAAYRKVPFYELLAGIGDARGPRS